MKFPIKTSSLITFVLLSLTTNALAYQIEKIFYLDTIPNLNHSMSASQLESIKNHSKSIDIIAPQVFKVDKLGIVTGNIDPRLIALADEEKIKVMPLVTNGNFEQDVAHIFLNDPEAQKRFISGLLFLCQQFHLYGFQFDFENININDKNALTQLFQKTAEILHKNAYKISIAVMPNLSFSVAYDQNDQYNIENWYGAYDYQGLANAADFISVMTYDQHNILSTPGPVAAADWVEKSIQTLLKIVPAEKISLGIPAYSAYWFAGKMANSSNVEKFSIRPQRYEIDYASVQNLLNRFNPTLIWQEQWQIYYAIYTNTWKNEYLFIEDAKSFRAKMDLMSRYHLRGISVWKLGSEDPAIWEQL